MKKAKCAIVVYKDNIIQDFKILTCKGDFIRVSLAENRQLCFKDMLKYIVEKCRMVGYNIESKKMFNATFYNIALIDIDKGYITDTVTF